VDNLTFERIKAEVLDLLGQQMYALNRATRDGWSDSEKALYAKRKQRIDELRSETETPGDAPESAN